MSTSRMRWPAWLQPAPDSTVMRMRVAGYSPRVHAWNLLWSFWVFLGPVFTHADPGLWWSLALGYPVFLMIFLLSYVRPVAEVHVYVGAMTLLAAISIPWNPAAWTYAVFACAMVPYEGSLYPSVSKITMIQALLVLEGVFLHWPWYAFVILVGVCTSTAAGVLMGRISSDKTIKLRISHDQIRQLAATAERERIGRDLHDLLGHTLSLITLKLELSRKLFDRDHAAAKRELEEAENVARHALAEVRSAVTGIRATDLAAELSSAHLLLESSGVRLVCDRSQPSLPAAIEPALAMIVREAVTNITRHAHATRAHIEVSLDGSNVLLRIADDGRGGVRQSGNGLNGMRERVQELEGTLRIESPRGSGTRLEIRVPLPKTVSTAPAPVVPIAIAPKKNGLESGHLAGRHA